MTRIRVLVLALMIGAAPVAAAASVQPVDIQSRGDRSGRQDDGERRISMAEASRIVESGRSGRFLSASNRGDVIVVRWDYGNGRIADITVDARTGRIVGER